MINVIATAGCYQIVKNSFTAGNPPQHYCWGEGKHGNNVQFWCYTDATLKGACA